MSNSEMNSSQAATQSSGEMLSTFMDGEMKSSAARFFARRLIQDGELQATWTRWHMVRDCMRDGVVNSIEMDLAARVSAALNNDPAPAQSLGRRLMRPLASGAIAATVAMAAIIGVNQYRATDAQVIDGQAVLTADADTSLSLPVTSSPDFRLNPVPVSYPLDSQRQGANPMARSRLDSYLMRHNQRAAAQGRAGFVSYVPVVVSGRRIAEAAAAQKQAEAAQKQVQNDRQGQE